MYFLHAINSDRQTRLLNVLGQIAMILGDLKKKKTFFLGGGGGGRCTEEREGNGDISDIAGHAVVVPLYSDFTSATERPEHTENNLKSIFLFPM